MFLLKYGIIHFNSIHFSYYLQYNILDDTKNAFCSFAPFKEIL